ncbi:hypothetical protein YPPY13_3242, partial [Yersinia pestis PY-13]
MNGEDRQRSK